MMHLFNYNSMKFYFLLLFSFFSLLVSAQSTNLLDLINDGTSNISSCEESYFLNNENGNFSSINYTLTICPDDSELVSTIEFTEYNVPPSVTITIYDGDDTSAPIIPFDGSQGFITASDDSTTGCLTIQIQSGFIPPTFTAEISFDVGCREPCPSDIEAVVDSISPSVLVSEDLYRVCLGDEITFTADGIFSNDNPEPAIYSWTLNSVPFDGQTITNTFAAPDLIEVVLTLTYEFCPQLSSSTTVFLQVGTEPLFDGTMASSTEVCEGEEFQLIGSAQTVPFEEECTPPVSGETFLPDGSGVSYETCINVECFADSQVVTSASDLLNVFANIEHSYTGDLDISITSPNGTEVFLFTQAGASNYFGIPIDNDANLNPGTGFDYFWTESASATMAASFLGGGQSLPAGDYLPVGNFNDFIGDSLNGDWCITVTDNIGSDNGFIFEWALNFDPDIVPPDAQFEPQIVDSYWIGFEGLGDIVSVTENESGQYCYTYVVVDDFDCTFEEVVCVDVLDNPEIQNLVDIIICVPDDTFIPEYDLTINDSEAIGTQDPALFEVNYYANSVDANDGINEILNPEAYTPGNVPFTIHTRIDNLDQSCFEIDTFILDTTTLNGNAQLDDLILCSTPGDTFAEFDLTENDLNALDGLSETDFSVDYFLTEQDAIDNEDVIINPDAFTNTVNPQEIFVRVSSANPNEEFCFETYSFTVDAILSPEITITQDLINCGDYTPLTQIFDLTQNNENTVGVVNPGILGSTYFLSQLEADEGDNPITDPQNYTMPTGIDQQTIFIRVQNDNNVDCFDIASFELFQYNVEVANSLPDLEVCAINDNGEGLFDLTQQNGLVFGANQQAPSYSISYFEELADANGAVNPITNPASFVSDSQEIWVRIDNLDNPEECFAVASFQIISNAVPEVFEVADINFCGDFTFTQEVDLASLEGEIFNGPNTNNWDLAFYNSQTDANNDVNAITDPIFIPIQVQTTLFYRATNPDATS
jgi:hypothetical protein